MENTQPTSSWAPRRRGRHRLSLSLSLPDRARKPDSPPLRPAAAAAEPHCRVCVVLVSSADRMVVVCCRCALTCTYSSRQSNIGKDSGPAPLPLSLLLSDFLFSPIPFHIYIFNLSSLLSRAALACVGGLCPGDQCLSLARPGPACGCGVGEKASSSFFRFSVFLSDAALSRQG